MLGGLIPFVGDGSFGRRHADSQARPAARFLPDSQARLFLRSHCGTFRTLLASLDSPIVATAAAALPP